MNSGTNVVTGEDVIGAALRLLARNGELGSHDVEKVELELPGLLERYRADPVTVDQLAARRGGLMSSGLVTTALTEPLVVAVVATLIAEGVKVGSRAVNGRVGRWWSGRRERRRLVAALREPALPVEARAQFDHSQLGPWVRETLRVHRDEAAARRAFDRTVADLADCAHFTISWSDLARTGTERLRETTGPRAGDRSWAAAIEVELGGFPSGETKTLVRQGRLLVVISHAAAPKAPPWAETEDITRRATERATRALDDV